MTEQIATETQEKKFHFYASSIAEWRVDVDLKKLVKFMENEPYAYNLFYIPLPVESPYEIKYYAPQVTGAIFLGQYQKAKRNDPRR